MCPRHQTNYRVGVVLGLGLPEHTYTHVVLVGRYAVGFLYQIVQNVAVVTSNNVHGKEQPHHVCIGENCLIPCAWFGD